MGSYTLLMSLDRIRIESATPSVLSKSCSVVTNLHLDSFVIASISRSVSRIFSNGSECMDPFGTIMALTVMSAMSWTFGPSRYPASLM